MIRQDDCHQLMYSKLGLTWAGSQYAWNSAHVIVPLVLGIVTLAAFVLWEGVGHPLPLIPLHIFRRKVVNGACLTMFINGWNFVVQVTVPLKSMRHLELNDIEGLLHSYVLPT